MYYILPDLRQRIEESNTIFRIVNIYNVFFYFVIKNRLAASGGDTDTAAAVTDFTPWWVLKGEFRLILIYFYIFCWYVLVFIL